MRKIVLLSALTAFAVASSSHAEIPPNDNFEAATDVASIAMMFWPYLDFNITLPGDNTEATVEADEPESASGPGGTLWWKWTAPTTGTVHYLFSANYFRLDVYTGAGLSNLVSLPSLTVDAEGGGQFETVAGGLYRLRVDSRSASPKGAFALTLRYSFVPTNDNFATRLRFSGTNVTLSSDNTFASWETNEPAQFKGNGKTLWWGFTAPRNGRVRLTGTIDSDQDVRGLTFTGNSLTNLTRMAFTGFLVRRDGSGFVEFEATAETEYQFQTDAISDLPFFGYRGPVTLHLEYVSPPTNDNFAGRTLLSGEAWVVKGTTIGATREAGEPVWNEEHTVWYSWTAPASGQIDISGNNWYRQTLTVYTGNTLQTLTLVENLHQCCQYSAHVIAGATYHVVVSTPFYLTGPFQLALSLNGRPVLAAPRFTSSGFELPMFGGFGSNYRIESSTNFMDWTPLPPSTNIDPSTKLPARFYRAVLAP